MVKRPASAVEWARSFVARAISDGSVAVDATAGKGQDTIFLAGEVGPRGKVYAFDVQEEALRISREKLSAAGLLDRVELLQEGHQDMRKFVAGPVDAVMFNLGYLPGSDRTIITRPQTTQDAIVSALELLSPRGRMSVVVYTGHPGAAGEARAVAALAAGLESDFTVLKLTFWNGPYNSPEVYFFARAGEVVEG